MKVIAVACAVVLYATAADAWYIPAVRALSYGTGDSLDVMVNSLTSHQGVMPFPFYSVATCTPSKEIIKRHRKRENLGELLWGNQIEPSLYDIQMRKNATCKILCAPVTADKKQQERLKKLIDQKYRGNMVLDNLPVAQETNAGPRMPRVLLGYPLGVPAKATDDKKTIIHNHLDLKIVYHVPADLTAMGETDQYRIVGFYVTPHSVKYTDVKQQCKDDSGSKFSPSSMAALRAESDVIPYTYSVSWVEDPSLPWATRWDAYLKGGDRDAKIHWFNIVNSLLVVLFLSAMVGMILLRTLHKDFNRYNSAENPNEAQEETGWKLVHGDVFRTPEFPATLAALIGTGSQLLAMSLLTLVLACIGYLSPSNRGALLMVPIFSFAVLGVLAGYVSARYHILFGGKAWKKVFLTAFLVPGTGMAIYFSLNLIQWFKAAASAIPFTTLLILFVLWLFVTTPLVLVGAAMGYQRGEFKLPCKTNAIPRMIPPQPWYLQTNIATTLGGMLPFGAGFIELIFILSSFWQGRTYYVFGFLAIVFFIVLLTACEVSVVLTYFTLCSDNYKWWWRAFLVGAAAGAHLYGYSLYYLVTVLTIRQPTSMALYAGYMFLGSAMFGLMVGTATFLSSFAFVRKIYGSIKLD